MIDPSWKRGNDLGRVEVYRYQPRTTLRLKLFCNDRTDLRMSIGIPGDKNASAPEHKFAPQPFNGWPPFGGNSAGHVPRAGPEDYIPLEVAIDLTAHLKDLGPDPDGEGRLFRRHGRADGREAAGKLYEGAVVTYDQSGGLLRETKVEIEAGNFGESPFKMEMAVNGLERE